MKVSDLFGLQEGKVIKVNFQRPKESPPESKKSSKKSLPSEVKFDKISQADIDSGRAVPISMIDAFGSVEMSKLNKIGIKFQEKPSYFEDFKNSKYRLSDLDLKKAERELGVKFKVYDAVDIFGGVEPRYPLARVSKMPDENVCIVKFKNGNRALVDTTQANTYIRMWSPIGNSFTE